AYDENDDHLVRTVTFPYVSGEGKRVFAHNFELVVRPGAGLITGQGSDPKVMLRVSRNGGRTGGPERWRALGKIGEYGTRVRWGRLGAARNFLFEVSVSDPVNLGILGAYLEATLGD